MSWAVFLSPFLGLQIHLSVLLNIRKQHSLSSCIILVNHPFSSTLQLSSPERIVFYAVSPSSPWKNILKIYIGLFLVMKQNDNTEDYVV